MDDTVKIGATTGAAPTPTAEAPTGLRKVLSLPNGDTITGHVQGLTDGIYPVVTANGPLKFKADEVKEIKDSEPAK